MPETKSLTQAQCDRAEEQAIHYLLELLAHKRRTLRCGRLDSALTDIEESARPLPDAVRHFLNRFLIRFFERERSHLRQQIWAAESDSTPQAEVNAAVRAISAEQRTGLGQRNPRP